MDRGGHHSRDRHHHHHRNHFLRTVQPVATAELNAADNDDTKRGIKADTNADIKAETKIDRYSESQSRLDIEFKKPDMKPHKREYQSDLNNPLRC